MIDSPFAVRAVIEGFYGVYYTPEERNSLIRFLARNGFNSYIYGPKNDWFHRERWRVPYPADLMSQLRSSVTLAEEVGISFCFAISPGLTICYGSEEDFALLTSKLLPFFKAGVRAFGLFLDDIPLELPCEADRIRGATPGKAHADLGNGLYRWLQALDPLTTLSLCPTHYHGEPPFPPYLHELGALLDPAIDVFYTGPEVCSPVVMAQHAQNFARVLRRPPLLWDNYPVNDLMMAPEMHIGPVRDRDLRLAEACRGIAINPMNQPEASRVPLLTYADYLAAPGEYNAGQSWERALREVGGDAAYHALRLFSENSLSSCLKRPEAEPLEQRVALAVEALREGKPLFAPPVAALEQYLADLEEASFYLKYRMENRALRQELLPWLDLLDHQVWVGKRALTTLREWGMGRSGEHSYRRMRELFEMVMQHPKHWGGSALNLLVEFVVERYIAREEIGADAAVLD